jgi:RNA-splicing ligase RtcB
MKLCYKTQVGTLGGKGNHESFQSCSHGAGRTLGRKQAQRVLDLEGEMLSEVKTISMRLPEHTKILMW